MSNSFLNLGTRRTRIAVLGNPVRDAYMDVDAIDFPERRVVFRAGQAEFDIVYQGETIRFGEKRYAQQALDGLDLSSFTIRNGGGVYHTATQLALLCAQRRLPVAISAIDLVKPWPELETAYTQWRIRHCSLGLEPIATNLVLTNGKPDRLILKSPDANVQLTPSQVQQLRCMMPRRLDLLVVNSLRSVDLARTIMHSAEQAGAAQYSVLTPSLALDARIELQLRHDQVSVCNLSEFALIAHAFGLDCPTHEEDVSLTDVAQIVIALARRCKMGDLVVTLGARGCLTADRTTGAIVHVSLGEHYWWLVQEHVLAHPERKNGVGDRFFGSLVVAHAFAKRGHSNRTAHAAQQASVEMARQLALGLQPDQQWIVQRVITSGFGPRRNHQIHRSAREKTQLLHKWIPSPAAVAPGASQV